MADLVAIGLELIERYGLLAIFILLVLDGALLLPVFPGELVLAIAITTYGQSPSDLLMLIALTSAAGLVGSILLYGVIRAGGRPLVDRFPRFFMMPRKRRERLERVFSNPFGQSLVLFLRLFPLTRVLVNIPAGLAKMPFGRFLTLSTVGLTMYHAGFLWFAYEARQPGSEVKTQADQLRDAYASPALEYVQTNSILTAIILLCIGAIASIRSSQNMLKDPHETSGSLLGNLAVAILFWGGLGLGAAIYLDPQTVFSLLSKGGVERSDLGPYPTFGLGGVALASVFLALSLTALRREGKKLRRHVRRMRKLAIRRRAEAAEVGVVVGEAVPLPAPESRPLREQNGDE